MSSRNKTYEKIVENPKKVRYAAFLKLMKAYGYEEHRKPGSRRVFVFDPARIEKTEADFTPGTLDRIQMFFMHAPHHSGDAVNRLTIKKAIENIDLIRMTIGEADSAQA